MIKPVFLLMLSLLLVQLLEAQSLSVLKLEDAYTKLEERYPALKNADLVARINQQELEKIDISRKPMVFLKADGRWQSEAVNLESDGAPLPFEIDRPLVSVTASLEVQYKLLDGGYAKAKKQLLGAQLKTEQQALEVDKYQLKEQINMLILNTMLLRQQQSAMDISLEDLATRKKVLVAAVEEGYVLSSEVAKLEVKQLELQSAKENMAFKEKGLLKQLSFLIGEELAPEVEFNFPLLAPNISQTDLDRPEQELFALQRESILAQSSLLNVHRKPTLGLYAQGGTGYPNPLNILDSDIAPYAVVGAQFSWKIIDWKQNKVDQELLRLKAQQINHAEETFEFNLERSKTAYLEESKRIQAQMAQDKKIMRLQKEILMQLAAQLDEGVITSSDYVIQVNAELAARQSLLIHQLELLQTHINFLNERGAL